MSEMLNFFLIIPFYYEKCFFPTALYNVCAFHVPDFWSRDHSGKGVLRVDFGFLTHHVTIHAPEQEFGNAFRSVSNGASHIAEQLKGK